jgi:hypothetical protein
VNPKSTIRSVTSVLIPSWLPASKSEPSSLNSKCSLERSQNTDFICVSSELGSHGEFLDDTVII